MDILSLVGLVMLVLWALGHYMLEAPGFIHGFLTLGVFFLVFGAIKRSERMRKGSVKG